MSGTMDDNCIMWKSHEEQLRRAILSRKGFAQLIGLDERLYKHGVYRDEQDFVRATKDSLSMLSLSEWKSLLEHIGFRKYSSILDMKELFTIELLQTLSQNMKNADLDCNNVLIIRQNFDQPGTHAEHKATDGNSKGCDLWVQSLA